MNRGQNPQDPWPPLSTPLDKEPIEIFEANEIDVPSQDTVRATGTFFFWGGPNNLESCAWVTMDPTTASIGVKSGLSVMNHDTLVI